jgi:2-polyprenyl-3-methyl-5-hydroxy-6-metoxy-1,4-benzoquinol methylase
MGIVERIVPGQDGWSDEIGSHGGRYRFAAQYAKGCRVLDAGCGVGYGTYLLAEAGASQVLGVDISAEALGLAREKFHHPHIEYVLDDCETLQNVQGPFGLIVSFENIEHLDSPERFVKVAAEKLSDDGVLICSTPNNPSGARSRPENPFHTREFNRLEFVDLLGTGFSQIKLLGQELTAAYLAAHRMSMNPAMRFGAFLQRLRGRKPYRFPPPSEGDWLITDSARDPANFVALCRSPRRA